MSLPEVMLWNALRIKPEGVKFRRQYGIGDYVLDFYCASAKAAFEIDGIAHDMGDRAQRDEVRDAWLQSQGIQVVRIPAAEVLRSAKDVAERLVRHCQR